MSKQTPALFKAKEAGRVASLPAKQLESQLTYPAAPIVGMTTTGAVRRAVDDTLPQELTPSRVVAILKNAQQLQNTKEFAAMLSAILRRDGNLRSVLTTRILSVVGADLVVEPAGDTPRERKVAQAVQELLYSDALVEALPKLAMAGIFYGYGAAELIWDTKQRPLQLQSIEEIPAEWVLFDKRDGKTPYFLPEVQGGEPQTLPRGKLLFHTPGLLPGLPITTGIGFTAAYFFALKHIVLKDWSGFVELYGQPMRVGYFPSKAADPEKLKKDQKVLKAALEGLGADAWAMLPDNFKVDFIDAATRTTSAEVYERLIRYLDETVAKMALGGVLTSGTGNTGYGGSLSLGNVHNEVRLDLVKADAKALAMTLRRDLVAPFVVWQFGANVPLPKLRFHIAQSEDLAALADALAKLIPLGLEVSQDELREKYGLRAPRKDEKVLRHSASPAPAADTSDTVDTTDIPALPA